MKVTLVLFGILCLALPRLSGQDRLGIDGDRLSVFRSAEDLTDARQDSAARVLYLSTVTGPDGTEIADSLTALAYHRIGTGYYNAARDTLAMPYFRRSLALRDSLFRGPHNERAHVRTNMGMSMYYYGDLDSSALLVQEASSIYERLADPDTLNWIKSLNQLGYIALRYDDYSLGYASSHRATELLDEMVRPDPEAYFVTYYQAARVLFSYGDTERAWASAEKALHFATDRHDDRNAAVVHNLLALIERRRGNDASGVRHLQRALQLPDTDKRNLRILGVASFYLAEHYASEGERAARDRSIARGRRYLARAGTVTDFYNRCELPQAALLDGDYAIAEKMLDAMLAELDDNDGSPSPADLVQHVNYRLTRAQVYSKTGRPDMALRDYAIACDLQDALRENTTDPYSRRYLSGNLRPDIDAAVRLQFDRFLRREDTADLWAALALSERARAYSLLNQMDRYHDDGRVGDLQRSTARLEREVAQGNLQHLSQLEANRLRLDRLRGREFSPGDTAATFDRRQLLNYLAKSETFLLEYFISDSLNLAFLVDPSGSLTAYPLGELPDLDRRVFRWTRAIMDSGYRRKSLLPRDEQRALDSVYLNEGRILAGYLLPLPLRQRLSNQARICVVPDGTLGYLPFAALPLEGKYHLPLDYQTIAYLQDSAIISYAHSGAHLSRIGAHADRSYESDLLAFSPEFGRAGDITGHRRLSSGEAAGVQLRPLLYNQEEVAEIAGFFEQAEVYLGSRATRHQFMDRIGRSRILHLSTHGSVDPGDPELSFVAFSSSLDSVTAGDLLYFNDLYGLSIDNEMTVLSACETGLGQLAVGETPLSFAAAFAAAGARSTLTTLWEVDDRATKDFMVGLYRQLTEGSTRADAVRNAQNLLRRGDYFHPYYWSAPTLYGDLRQIDMGATPPRNTIAGWPLLALCCAGIGSLFILYQYRN